jgi:hypothetical protein
MTRNLAAKSLFAAWWRFSVMASRRALAQSERLRKVREEFWPGADAWTGVALVDDGWFKAPRTLPLILALIRDKRLTPKGDPTGVYVELLSRQFGDGIVEIQNQAEHAYAAGYTTERGAKRTWEDHIRLLESLGFIKTKAVGANSFKYVLIVHPSTAIHELDKKGLVSKEWMDVYRDRCIVTKELSYDERQAARQRSKIQSISAG